MKAPHRITVLLALLALACTTKKEIRAASTSAYDTDFAIVFSESLAAVRELYPNLDEDPAAGTIKTAWHQVQFSTGSDDPRSQQITNQTTGVGQGGAFTTPQGQAYKRLFIRFDVSVVGGRPWRVKVSARASEWDPGNAQPTELKGAAVPHWLPGRRDALIVAIYRRLKAYAIHVEDAPEVVAQDEGPPVEPEQFGDIPPEAAEAAVEIVKAVERRNIPALRAHLADDVLWSFGAEGDADTALAMWQADPESLAALTKSLRAGCRKSESPTLVTCPPEAAEQPGYLGWRATLELRGEKWLLTAFVRGD